MHEKQYLPHKKQKNRLQILSEGGFRALLGTRTRDPNIKSVVLYQLS